MGILVILLNGESSTIRMEGWEPAESGRNSVTVLYLFGSGRGEGGK